MKAFVLYVVVMHPVADIDSGLLYRREVYAAYDTLAECDRHIDRALHQYKIKGHRPSIVAGCITRERLLKVHVTIARPD